MNIKSMREPVVLSLVEFPPSGQTVESQSPQSRRAPRNAVERSWRLLRLEVAVTTEQKSS